MTKETIYETVVKVIRQQRHEDDLPVTPEMSLRDDLGVDSIELMNLSLLLKMSLTLIFRMKMLTKWLG